MDSQAGIKALKLDMDVGGQSFVVHASVLWDDKDVILVDTGIPGQLGVIRDAMERENISFDKLTKIIITHQDRDHIGSLPALLEAFEGRIEVFAHEIAKPYLSGEIPLIKSGVYATPSHVDVTLQDGDLLPYCGGIQVIFTPGHTPDHISLYHKPSKTVISGDALTSNDGIIMPPSREHTPDMESALNSVAKLLDLDIDTVITYHGGVCTDGIKERLAEIAGQGGAI